MVQSPDTVPEWQAALAVWFLAQPIPCAYNLCPRPRQGLVTVSRAGTRSWSDVIVFFCRSFLFLPPTLFFAYVFSLLEDFGVLSLNTVESFVVC